MTQHQKTGKKESLLGSNLVFKKEKSPKGHNDSLFLAMIPFYK